MNIGIVIKEVRKQKGLTQLELADGAGLSARTIQRIENDEVEATDYSLKSIGKSLDVDLIEIKNKNSVMYTSRILGLHLNDLKMKTEENADYEERLEKIEAHLAEIARTRSTQLKVRKHLLTGVVIIAAVLVLVEILAALHVFA